MISALFLLMVLLLLGTSVLGIQIAPGSYGLAGYVICGMSVTSLIFHGLGALSILDPKNFLSLVLAMSLFGLVRSRCMFAEFPRMSLSLPARRPELVATIYFSLLIGAITVLVLPIIQFNTEEAGGYDALAYHMYSPLRALWWTHSLNANDLAPNAGLPLGAGSLHALFVLLGGEVRSSFVNLLILATLLLGSCRAIPKIKVGIMTSAIIALLVLISGPLVFGQLSSDTLLAAFMPILFRRAQAIFARRASLSLGDICLLANLPIIKPFGIIPLVLLSTIGFIHIRTSKSFWMFVAALIPTIGWWTKNLLQVSSPFYPMFSNLFRPKFVDVETLSLEDDVRRSFGQLLAFFQQQFSWNLFSASNDHGSFFFIVLVLAAAFLTITCWSRLEEVDKVLVAIAAVSLVLIVSIAGPVFRYVMFVWVLLAVLFVGKLHSQALGDLASQRLRQVSVALCVVIVLVLLPHGLRGNGVSRTFQGRENTARIAEAAIVLESSISSNKVVCVFGEGRLLQFWPNRTQYLHPDLRNPFTSPTEIAPPEVKRRLERLQCDYLLLFQGWGMPRNLNLKTLEKWKSEMRSVELLPEGGWFLYEV